jgi:hypothetical protein
MKEEEGDEGHDDQIDRVVSSPDQPSPADRAGRVITADPYYYYYVRAILIYILPRVVSPHSRSCIRGALLASRT